MALTAVKVVLSTKKTVILREPKISDTEKAAQEVAPKSNGDNNLMQVLMQKVLVKNLLLQVDDKKLSASEKEDMDGLFSIAEYTQLLKVVAKMSGLDEMGKDPQLEAVSFGDN